jgi:hypothetical protein
MVIWQSIAFLVNFAFFRTVPTMPVLIGGTLIVVGGMVVSFWKA